MMLSKTACRVSALPALRRAGMRRCGARFQSSSSSSSSSSSFGASHVAAGVAGGATVVLIGYGWYHTSGLKTAVQTSQDVKAYLQSTRDSVVAKAKETAKNPSQALLYLRNVAKSYAGVIPGAQGYVDKTFDEFDALHEEHGPEMDKILSETTSELHRVASEGGADAQTATRVYAILNKAIERLQGLGKKAGSDLLERNPAIKEKLGDGFEQLVGLAGKAGPEGKKALEEISQQIKDLVSKGKVDDESINRIKQLMKEKSGQIKKVAESSGGQAFEAGSDKLKVLLNAVPGSEELKEKVPNLDAVLKLANERSQEAKKLAEETFTDVLNVLNEKGKKAKALAEKAKEDAKSAK